MADALATTLASAGDLIATEDVMDYVLEYNWPNTVGEVVAWKIPALHGSTPVQVPQSGGLSIPAGSVTETEDMTRVAWTTDSETLTAVPVAAELRITDQLRMGSRVSGVSEVALHNALMAMRTRRDSDVLALLATANENFGSTSTTLTRAQAKLAINRAQAKFGVNGGNIAFLIPSSGVDSLSVDELTTTATSATMMATFGPQSGYLGFWHGAQLFGAPQAPAAAPGYVGGITPIGDGQSALGIAQAYEILVEVNRGAEGARSLSSFMAISSYYGVGITHEDRLLGVRMA